MRGRPTATSARDRAIIDQFALSAAEQRIAALFAELQQLLALFPQAKRPGAVDVDALQALPALKPAQTAQTPKKKTLSAKGMAAIVKAQKARWAAHKAKGGRGQTDKKTAIAFVREQFSVVADAKPVEAMRRLAALATRNHHRFSESAIRSAYHRLRAEDQARPVSTATLPAATKDDAKARAAWTPERRARMADSMAKMRAAKAAKHIANTTVETIQVGPADLQASTLMHPENPHVDPQDGHIELSPERVLAPIAEPTPELDQDQESPAV